MPTINGTHIYTGPWINWSHGPIFGSTVTLSARDGGLFTSFLGVFVTIVSGRLWLVLCFIIHQMRAVKAPQDGLHHQHQNIFRNTTSPAGAAWQFTQGAVYWRKHTRHPFRRSLPWAILGTVYLALFGLAGVFSSEVTKSAGTDRLIQGPNCGTWLFNQSQNQYQQALNSFSTANLNETIVAANYARACYGGSHDPLQCNVYAKTQIIWTYDQNATCPFASGTCLMSDTAAYKMDTGLINSHDDLGINAPNHERVTYRKVTNCAPLHTSAFVEAVNGSDTTDGTSGDTIWQFFYGPTTGSNSTYSYDTHTALDGVGYTVQAVEALLQGNGDWTPIPDLNHTDADITIIFIAPNAIKYQSAVSDPIFSANNPISVINPVGQNVTLYVADHLVSVLACTDQHQICNPNTGQCTPLTGATFIQSAAFSLGLSTAQMAIMQQMTNYAISTNINEAVFRRGQGALRAQETVSDNLQVPLPDNQWMLEVSSWFSLGLARLQRSVVEYATGPANILPGSYVQPPSDAASKALCYSQKVKLTDGTISFSVLGVAIILVIGCIIIFTSLVLPTATGFAQRIFQKGEYARLNWALDDKLQLQRMVFEEAGMGTWHGATDSVPVTEYGQRFGGWDDIDRHHLRLKRFIRPNDEALTEPVLK